MDLVITPLISISEGGRIRLHYTRVARNRRRRLRRNRLLAVALALALIIGTVALVVAHGGLPTLPAWVSQPATTNQEPESTPPPAPITPPPAAAISAPLAPILVPYQSLLEAKALLDAGHSEAALPKLDQPPADGYWRYWHHWLKAQALAATDSAAARSEAELALKHALGPERTAAGVLLAELRAKTGDYGGAVDLLLSYIPSTDLLFQGPVRLELIKQLQAVAGELSPAVPANRDRLLKALDLFLNYGLTHDAVRLAERDDWPTPIGLELATLRVRTRAQQGETDKAIEELATLAAEAPPADAAYLHYLRAIFLAARERPDEAREAYASAAAAGAGNYSGGMSVYRLAEPFLDADQIDRAEPILTQHAAVHRGTTGWGRGAWELLASAYATGDAAAVDRALVAIRAATPDDPRLLYWQYRVGRERGNADPTLLTNLLTRFPLDYHALVAQEEWPDSPPAPTSDAGLSDPVTALKSLVGGPLDAIPAEWRLPVALWRAGYRSAAIGVLRQIAEETGDWTPLYLLSQWEGERGQHRESIRLTYRLLGRLGSTPTSGPVLQSLYPRFYWDLIQRAAAQHAVDPYFVLAIMREESVFEPTAHSMADARGLMQIMPATGTTLAKRAGLSNFTPDDLLQPEIAIPLGVAFLAELLERFDGDTRLAAAAYNAGPNSVDRWLLRTSPSDMALFVERIPYVETRNYVKKTDTSYRLYRNLYENPASQ